MSIHPKGNLPDNGGRRIFPPGTDPKYPWTEAINRLTKFFCLLCKQPVWPGESYWRRGVRSNQDVKGIPKNANFRWVRVCPTCYQERCT